MFHLAGKFISAGQMSIFFINRLFHADSQNVAFELQTALSDLQ